MDSCQSFLSPGDITIDFTSSLPAKLPSIPGDSLSVFLVAKRWPLATPDLCFQCIRKSTASFRCTLFLIRLYFWRSSKFIVLTGSCCFWGRRGLLNLFIVMLTRAVSAIDQLLGKCQVVMLQNRSSPCLIDACRIITGMMHVPLLTLVICHQAFWWIVLSSGTAGTVCLQTERHLRQALNGSIRAHPG